MCMLCIYIYICMQPRMSELPEVTASRKKI